MECFYLSTHWLLWLLVLVQNVYMLDNGLARTPPMGWMSWGYFKCYTDCNSYPDKCINEKLILSVADAFYTQGYQEAGYEYIIIDDCWSEHKRDAKGRLVADRKRFPNGIEFLAKYIHSRGLKLGMYTNIGSQTCMGYPGSRDHFKEDIQQFAEWKIDYLKVDGCFVEYEHLETAYIEIEKHLNSTGRPIVFSCSWPFYVWYIHKKTFDYNKTVKTCNLWRNFHDVEPRAGWGSTQVIINHYKMNYENFTKYHGPGHWFDPDMLLIATGVLTPGQSRVQFTVYAMLSAPLLISCPMDHVTKEERSLLQNMNLLAIAQDSLGIMAQPFDLNDGVTLWVKQHEPRKGNMYHSFSFALVNVEKEKKTVSFLPAKFGLKSLDYYTVFDVFNNKYLRNITLKDEISATVPAEDVVLYAMYAL